jgi:diguanylate cyclase (GGDEF)-like protein/PAS domain S-box-containing protein
MTGETILVVDDSHQVADFIAYSVLPALGFKSRVAYNGKTALEIASTGRIALMLLDMNMPDISGMDVLRKLSEQGHNIPVILITAEGSEEVAVDAFRLGVQDYLTKPVEVEKLRTAITKALASGQYQKDRTILTSHLKEKVSWLTTLNRIGRTLTSTLDVDEVLRRIVEAGVQLTEAEEGFLAMIDERSGQLYLRAAKNIDERRVRTMHLPVSDSLLGTVISTGRPYRNLQTKDEPRLKVSTGYLVHSLLHVPILSKGKVLGVFSVDNQINRRPFSEMDETLLTSLADYASVALENAALYRSAQQEITTRKQVEEALRESEERYALAVQGANDGIWDWNLNTNKLYFSPRWKSMLGYSDDEITDSPKEWFTRVHPEDIERLRLDISAHIKGVTQNFENEHRVLHRDGSFRWMLSRGMAVRDEENIAYRLAGSLTDITDRKYSEEKLLHNAFYDGLTNLPNRALFMDRLRYSVARAKRFEEYIFAVLFLDLDRFKNVNDSLGHQSGDKLLVAIAERLSKGLRSTDTVARLGGDEFVVLLEDLVGAIDATRLADWIQDQLKNPFNIDGHEVFITTSIGIVLSSNGSRYDRPEDLLRDADIAMYSAKGTGKAHYEIFDPTMRARILERLELEAELRRAIDNNELRVYYQPIVSLKNGRLHGFEALVRWEHPERGTLSPGRFIPLAEETGLIIPLDRWVMFEACRQLRQWQLQMPNFSELTVSINLSGKQVMQPGLVDKVKQVLEDTGLEPRFLKLEMTENDIMENNDLTRSIFSQLQALGVQVEIDDFGVGYSSLNYLSQFPVNALKIDQSFVAQMTNDTNQLKIVQAIVMLTERLGVGVIAEGMETQKQMETLKKLGCQYGQGNLISEPTDSQHIFAMLTAFPKEETDFITWSASHNNK